MPQRILVVEDDADAAAVVRDLLIHEGFEVEVARTGERALAVVRGFAPSVVLCDLTLPGLSGWDVALALRADPHFAQVKLVALTGNTEPDVLDRTLKVGFDGYLVKPADPATLVRLLHSYREPS